MSTYTQQVTAARSDGRFYVPSNYWYVNGNYLTVGSDAIGFFRFTNLPMNQGATIDSAYFKIWTHEYGSGNSVTLKVRAIDQDDTALFPASNGTNTDPGARPRTSAGVDFDFAGTRNTLRTSPDIKTVIQEVIDRPGWDGGNALAIALVNDGGTYGNDLNPYDYNASKAAELVINYTGTSTYEKQLFSVGKIINPERDVGIKVMKPTHDVDDTENPANQIFNSDYDSLKYYTSGSTSVVLASGDLAGASTISHNLGYYPYIEAYSRLDDDTYWYPCPFKGAGATVLYGATFRATTTQVTFYAESTGFAGSHTYYFKYFIFRNDLDL